MGCLQPPNHSPTPCFLVVYFCTIKKKKNDASVACAQEEYLINSNFSDHNIVSLKLLY